jgi:LacI family transcriptional regulator
VSSDEVGRRAARLLIAKLEGQPVDPNFECDAEVIVRKSSGPVPKR